MNELENALVGLGVSEHMMSLLFNPIFRLGMIVGSEYTSEWYDKEIERIESECTDDCENAYKRGLAESNKLATELDEVVPSHSIIASVYLI
ncbi:hypothetical protein [Klebsiella quasivariicola]|uniref:Uncharacterized protein n=1 Tax=Klebsiella quasivariicola TaxID=2026240 RepID=A0A8B4TKE9_9ENTR|nr:hypothetical protein [Klebsiella quasivariicola]SXD86822.1 Uncharacterised protein [Klebsiella quasivariicola]